MQDVRGTNFRGDIAVSSRERGGGGGGGGGGVRGTLPWAPRHKGGPAIPNNNIFFPIVCDDPFVTATVSLY